jgi:CRISPR-associated protein Cmr3
MTNNSYNYLVHLRPLDFYFFGGETTFGNGEEANYYAKTRKYPQQTTLLGVLRHLGYKAQGIGPGDIGESFSAEEYGNQGKYGYIKEISPLFFTKKTADKSTHYLPGPMWLQAQTAASPAAVGPKVKRWLKADEWKPMHHLPAYNPKKWKAPPFLGSDASVLAEEELFTTANKIGITKQTDGEERTDGFYKQEIGYLQQGVSFSFLANLADRASNIVSPQVLPVGAEKALFSIELVNLEPSPKSLEDYFEEAFPAVVGSTELCTALLTSDAFVDEEKYHELPFAVSDTEDFRYISTPSRVTDFGRFNRHGQKTKKHPDNLSQSRKYNLLRRGTLLYATEENTLTELLDQTRWQTIGYNHYQLFPKK